MVNYRTPKKKRRSRPKKSFLRKKTFWLFLLGFIFSSAVSYLLFFSEVFQIKKIEISGNEMIDREVIYRVIESGIERRVVFFNTKNIFLVSLTNIEKDVLREFPSIYKINLKRGLPDKVISEITERKKITVFCLNEENCFDLDKEGVIFKSADEKSGLVIFSSKENASLSEKVIEKEKLDSILEIFNELKNLNLETEKFSLSENRLDVKTKPGFDLYFDLKDEAKDQIFNLGLILKKEVPPEKISGLEYIDLRFGNRVYYKYRQ